MKDLRFQTALGLVFCALCQGVCSEFDLAVVPTSKIGIECSWAPPNYWLDRVERKRAEIAASDGTFDVVFLGDSITHNWEGWPEDQWKTVVSRPGMAALLSFGNAPGRKVLERLSKSYSILNLGIGGDATGEVLWRVRYGGQLDGYKAKCVVLMIGTNNRGSDPAAVAKGIRVLLDEIAKRQPEAVTLLLPIFPRGEKPTDPYRIRNKAVNGLIRNYADGREVIWVDFNDKFLTADGTLTRAMMPDLLHPGPLGYEIWADALAPHLSRICGPAEKPVCASSFGWNPTNATACLQAAFDSGAHRILVDRQAGEWLVDTVRPRSNTEIIFEDGVKVRAMPGTMAGITDCLFRLRGVTNVVLRGERGDRSRAVLQMNVRDYLDPARYTHGEHRHCVSLYRAEHITVRDLTLLDSGGDGVYVLRVKHALIENLYCSGHARQGTSIISADDVTIRDCFFTETKGALPECGMDVEPGDSSMDVENIVIDSCVMCSNNCSGVAVNVTGLKDTNRRLNVIYRKCRMFDNAQRGLWLMLARGTWAPVKGSLRFESCDMRGNGSGPCQICNLGSDALHVSFLGCTFDCTGAKGAFGSPIEITNGNNRDDLNNLAFERCSLSQVPDNVRPVSFAAMTGCGVLKGGAIGLLDVTYASGKKEKFDFGTLENLYPPKPELRMFETCPVDLKALVPVSPDAKPSVLQKMGSYRYGCTFLQYVGEPGEYPIHISTSKIGKYDRMDVVVEVFDINGTPHDVITLPTADYTYTLKAQSRNSVYRFKIKTGSRTVRVKSEVPGHGFVANDRIHWLTGNNQSVYFQVKPDAEDVRVQITMSPAEWVSAELIASDGTVRDGCEKATCGVILSANRPKGAPSEIWQLHVTHFEDDAYVSLGSGTSGIYGYDPELLLIVGKETK